MAEDINQWVATLREVDDRPARMEAAYKADVARIRAQPGQSDEGLQGRLSDAHAGISTGLRQLQREREDDLGRAAEAAQKGLWHLDGDQATLDSYDQHISQLEQSLKTPGQAMRELDRARLTGNVLKARAIGYVSQGKGWRSVVDSWAAGDPSAAQHLEALDTVDLLRSPAGRIAASTVYSPPAPPDEIRHLTSSQRAALAASMKHPRAMNR